MEWYFSDISRSISALIMILVFVGIALRRNRFLHPKIMLTCFAADLGLVAYIELSREVIEHSNSAMTPLLFVHIALAVTMLGCYAFLWQTGRALLKLPADRDLPQLRKTHKIVAIAFVLLRLSVMITAVYVAFEVNAASESA